ncbi:hypothetical protein [Cohnella mopanensis]|uniref:hypothetical protein n=1 Tax=Cohnella mopanensis TaxID=2911966 RepID=UPI001EF94327|nr:hypothetical protein [Cohnella mopanensis]
MRKNLLTLLVILLVCAGCIAKQSTPDQDSSRSSEYTDDSFKVSLRYPSDWNQDTSYLPSVRYVGNDGFFQIDAGGTGSITIDEFASINANHTLNPFGTKPEIISLEIDNQDARLIKPSNDQPDDMKDQACLIVKYPNPVKIGDTRYNFVILYSDSKSIEKISATLTFDNEANNK